MEYNICKFCGKKLKTYYFDHYDVCFYCTCDGMKKYSHLMDELRSLNNQIDKKKDEIDDFLRENSLYNKIEQEIKTNQRKLECFKECDEWLEH